MKCPYCNQLDTRVIDSRPAEEGNSIRRRRSCDVCGKRFTTYEKIETGGGDYLCYHTMEKAADGKG